MDYQNILSNEFRELDLIAKKQKEKYISAYPFPHITVRNFFSNDFLNQVLDEFPDLSKLNESQNYSVKNEIKLSNKNYNKFPQTIKSFFNFLNADFFLNFLQNITSIKEKLVSDPHLEGGGLH